MLIINKLTEFLLTLNEEFSNIITTSLYFLCFSLLFLICLQDRLYKSDENTSQNEKTTFFIYSISIGFFLVTILLLIELRS
jgi:ascorbate-specific PTS system EIIC-type component UlaA